MSVDVSIVKCPDYGEETVRAALTAVLEPLGGLGWVRPGMRVAVKANLVARMRPETAAVTHPALVAALCRMLADRGAEPIVGDSPGGPFNAAWVNGVYAGTGMKTVEKSGGKLNQDFGVKEINFAGASVAKEFSFTAWLDQADAVIDFAKLKTHGLAGLSCAVKNFFGVIPGTRKPEFHYLYPRTEDFCGMLVDLNEYVRPRLTLVDAVDCMEGNGPTQGTPRHMGALIAAATPYAADLLCAHLIGMTAEEAPTVAASVRRGLCPDSWEKLDVAGDPEAFALPDFEKMPPRTDTRFDRKSRLVSGFLERNLGTGPRVDAAKCVGCGKCQEVCPAGAARVRGGRAHIDRRACIRCFCCQEFCPRGAVRVCRPLLARVLTK